jgi:hypothetical protein
MPSLPARFLTVASLALVLAGCGGDARGPGATGATARAAAAGPGDAQTCAATVDGVVRGVAARIYDQAAHGRNVQSSVRRLARSRALSAAVAHNDPAAVSAVLRPLLRSQIQRIVVTRGSDVLAALGTGAALAPVDGVIRDAVGVPIGRYTLSVGEDGGIAGLIRAVTGAQVVMATAGQRVATLPAAGRRALPASGTATIGRVRYSISSFAGTAFPAGRLRLWLLTPPANPALCATSTAATVANTVGAVGQRLLGDEQHGAPTARVLRVVSHDPRVAAAVAADDPGALRTAIVRLFRDPTLHVVRIRAVTAGGKLVNDVGGPDVLAPASAPLRAHGRVIGGVTLSVQDDTGYIKLMRRFTGAAVLLRTPSGQVPGSSLSPGPPQVPGVGPVTYRGRAYQAFSFPARAFPSGPLQISLLVPKAAASAGRER